MTVEELLSLVNKEVDTTKFKALSQKTINEELNDVLDEFGDDEAANAKIVTKVANRLKRMDGNLHKNVSDEIKKSREEAERKKKEEEERNGKKEEEDKSDDKYDKLLAKLEALEKANEERDKKASRAATIEAVRKGLKDKFDKAKLELNDFFLDTAISKLEIPDKDADVIDLVSKAEVFTLPTSSVLQATPRYRTRVAALLLAAARQSVTTSGLTSSNRKGSKHFNF